MSRDPKKSTSVVLALALCWPVMAQVSDPGVYHSLPGTGAAVPMASARMAASVETRITELRQPASGESLLANGGLESEAGWTRVGEESLVQESGDGPAEGARCMVISSATQPGARTGLRSEAIPLRGAAPLIFSGQFRVEGGLVGDIDALSRAGVLVQWLRGDGSVLDEDFALTLEGAFAHWRRLMRRLQPPAGAQQTRLVVGTVAGSAGAPVLRLAVDDLRLIPAGDFTAVASDESIAVQRWSVGDVSVTSRAEEIDDATRITLTAAASGEESAAAEISVSITLPPGEWTYQPDLIRSIPLTPGARTTWSVTADCTGDLPLSVMPLAAVSSSTETIGLVVPPTSVEIHEFRLTPLPPFPTGEGGSGWRFEVVFPVGVVPGREENIELWVHRGPGSWGARGVYAHHLAIRPEHFLARGTERRLIHVGTAFSDRPVANPEDFGMHFLQRSELADPQRSRVIYEQAAQRGVSLGFYILPFADEPTVAPAEAPLPSLAECLSVEAAGAGESGALRELRLAGARSRVHETNGDPIISRIVKPSWRDRAWVLTLPQDLSLGIGGGRGPLTLDFVRRARENAASLGVPMPFVQMDNFMADSAFVLTDEPHVRACEGPLTFSPNTLEPAAPLAENHVRWLRALGEAVSPDGVLSANVLRAGAAQFGIPYLDAFAFECRAAREPERSENWALEDLAWRRALAVQRPVGATVTAIPPRGQSWTRELGAAFAEEIWRRCLVFAFTPTIVTAWDSEPMFEALRPTYQHFIPIVRRLEEAGWEPVTAASVAPAGIVTERYGRGGAGDVLLALHNANPDPAQASVAIDWPALGVAAPKEVSELVENQTLPVTEDGRVALTLAPGHTAVLLLGGS